MEVGSTSVSNWADEIGRISDAVERFAGRADYFPSPIPMRLMATGPDHPVPNTRAWRTADTSSDTTVGPRRAIPKP